MYSMDWVSCACQGKINAKRPADPYLGRKIADMNIIRTNTTNIDQEHICCAIGSDKENAHPPYPPNRFRNSFSRIRCITNVVLSSLRRRMYLSFSQNA